jgi:hypothetical protein
MELGSCVAVVNCCCKGLGWSCWCRKTAVLKDLGGCVAGVSLLLYKAWVVVLLRQDLCCCVKTTVVKDLGGCVALIRLVL